MCAETTHYACSERSRAPSGTVAKQPQWLRIYARTSYEFFFFFYLRHFQVLSFPQEEVNWKQTADSISRIEFPIFHKPSLQSFPYVLVTAVESIYFFEDLKLIFVKLKCKIFKIMHYIMRYIIY